MKRLRQLGSLVFVAGLFVAIFGGIPWAVITAEDPVVPWWLRLAIFSLLGGILVVLVTLALEERPKLLAETPPHTDPDRSVFLLNSEALPDRAVTEVLGLVQGHTVFAIWLGQDLSAIVRLILGGELTEYTEMMGRARAAATNRMIAEATALGADAIVNVRYMTTSVVGTAAELFAYGTAVRLSE